MQWGDQKEVLGELGGAWLYMDTTHTRIVLG